MRVFLALLALIIGVTSVSPVFADVYRDDLEIILDLKDADHGDAHHGDDAHHDEVQGLPQLNPSSYSSQIFWLVVAFALMHVVFRFKVIPDVSNIVDRRREQIESDLTAAQNLKEQAEGVHAEYEQSLVAAREKSSALYERVELKIKQKGQDDYAAFQEKSAKDIAEAEADIAKATKRAMKEMNEVAAEVASLAAEKIVGVKADKKSAASVVKNLGKKKAA